MATYQNPFLYGFSPWPFDEEDLTTTEAGIPVGAAGAANLAYGEDSDPFIAPLTYEGAKEYPVETYAGNVAPADTTFNPFTGLADPASVQSTNLRNLINQSRTTIPMTLAEANLTGSLVPQNIDIEKRSYDVTAPLTNVAATDLYTNPLENLPIEERSYDLTAAEQAKAGANLTGSLVPQNIEALPPVYDAEQAWLEDMGLVGPYEKMSEFASGFTTDEDEDELKKSGLKKFFAQFKKSVGTFAERTREALKKTRDAIAPNFGLNREELTGQGYTDSQVDFMMMNALGKQAVDEGLFVDGFDYKNTSSGVQDKWNYNVYASNYQEPGSASYDKWKNIKDSKAYKIEQAKKVAVTQAVSKGGGTTGGGTTGGGTTGDEGGIGQWQGPGTQGVAGDVQQSGSGRQEEPGGGSFGGSSEPPSDDGGYQGTGSEAAQDNYGGGWDDGYWAKGGLIRKKYGNGGIVDLL